MWFFALLGLGIVGAFLALRWLDNLDGINRFKRYDEVQRNTMYVDNTQIKNPAPFDPPNS
jgi:hypothetical protein